MLKVAVIGAGTMGSAHSEAYVNMSDTVLVGIVDIREDVGRNLAESQRTNYYKSFEDLIASESPDLIDVCVPTSLHREYVEKAAKSKKHVICEKPLARNLEDARAMIKICKEEGVKLFVAQVVRFFPDYQKIYRLVAEQKLGKIGTVRTMRGGVFPTAWDDWYANVEKSGTLIVDMIIHDFDFLRWCFGDVERVFAKSHLGRDFNRIDHTFVSLRFKNGVIAHVEGSWAYPSGFKTEIEIAGSNGVLIHNSEDAVPIRSTLRENSLHISGVAVPESPLKTGPYQVELEHFVSCIINGTDPIVTAEDGFKALEISLAALESVKTGKVVALKEVD
ncbi:putative dehydrogenase [Bacillus niacini]|uniref:Dehydrogenase n=1 Tax=Neobacillus niacini TaxID=86668 RepID=A0A852TLI3_9BACI|nr:Gfo/Idh/MocA family oxidoreductase [Neobacillus niacini]NYE09011.1 putative dehydrogenase [Neobacillus niacini]